MPTTLCPSADQLVAFQSGRLKHDDLQQIAAHLESCAACQTALESGGTVSDALMRELKQARADPFTEESACRRAVGAVEAMANGAATQTRGDTADNVPATAVPGAVTTLGKYQLLEQIGQGGMGEVYKARHTLLNRIVAVKILPPHRLSNADAVARFRREIEAAGRLDHPHIVRASDADSADGRHFLVMEWLAGADLAHHVKAHGPLSVDLACDFIRQAALGLDYAHKHGMVHRDVKPSNLYLTAGEDGRQIVKVLDLGLALLHDTITAQPELTSAGQVMGTYDFIAPEQAMESHSVDARADIYSLGCTFYYLLTGQTPFAGKSEAKKLLAHQLEEPTPIANYRSDVPAAVIAIVTKMMAKDPAQRFATMRDVVAAIPSPATSSPLPLYSGGEGPGVRGKKRPMLVATSILLGLAAVVALVFGIIRITTPEGDYVIETDDPTFAFSVSKGTVVLEDKLKKRTFQVKAVKNKGKGEWELEITDPANDTVVAALTLTIKRGEKAGLKMWFEAREKAIAKLVSGDPDRRAAEWVLSIGGNISIKENDKERPIDRPGDLPLGAFELTAVDLNSIAKVSDAGLVHIRDCKNLTYLNLGATRASDTGLAHFKDCKNLTYLNLNNTNVTDAGLAHFKDCKLLTHLSVYYSTVSNLGLVHFRDCAFTTLHLGGTNVDDDGLVHFKNCNNLKYLDLGGLKVSDKGLANFKDCKNLIKLHVGTTQVGNAGLALFRDCKYLTHLNCQNTKVTDLSILKRLPLKDLHCHFRSGRDYEIVRSITTLETINNKPAAEFWKEVAAKAADTAAPALEYLHTIQPGDHGWDLAFTADGKFLYTGGTDPLRKWDAETGKFVKAFEKDTPRFALSPDERHVLAFCLNERRIEWIPLANPKEGVVQTELDKLIPGFLFCPVAISGDGKRAAVGLGAGKVAVFDINEGRLVFAKTADTGLKGAVVQLAFRPGTNDQMLVFSDHKGLLLWNLTKGQAEATPVKDGSDSIRAISFLAFSARGDRFIYHMGFDDANWFDLDRLSRKSFAGLKVRGAGFVGNDRWIVTCHDDKKLRLWDADNLDKEVMAKELKAFPAQIAVSPKGDLIAVRCQEGVQLWRVTKEAAKESPPIGAKGPLTFEIVTKLDVKIEVEVRDLRLVPSAKFLSEILFNRTDTEQWRTNDMGLGRVCLDQGHGLLTLIPMAQIKSIEADDKQHVVNLVDGSRQKGTLLTTVRGKDDKVYQLSDAASIKVRNHDPAKSKEGKPAKTLLTVAAAAGKPFRLSYYAIQSSRLGFGQKVKMDVDGEILEPDLADFDKVVVTGVDRDWRIQITTVKGKVIAGKFETVGFGNNPYWWLIGETPNGWLHVVANYHGNKGFTLEKLKDEPAPKGKAEVGEIQTFRGHDGPVHCVAFTPDGKSFLSGGAGEILLWDVDDPGEKRRFKDTAKPLDAPGRNGIGRIAISRDGKKAISGGDDHVIRIWDVDKGQVVKHVDAPKPKQPAVQFVAWSPDDRFLFVAPAPSFARLYAYPSLEESKNTYGGTQGHFSKDGDKLLTLEGNILQVYHLAQPKRTSVNVTGIHHCALTPDGRYAVAGGFDSMVYVYDMVEGKQVHKMAGHKGSIQALAVSPDGKRALSGGGDNMVRLWDLTAGKEIRSFKGHGTPVGGVAFSPDGQRALSAGGSDKTIRLWQLPD